MEKDSNTLKLLREILCIHAETQTYWHRRMIELALNILWRWLKEYMKRDICPVFTLLDVQWGMTYLL